MLLLVEMQGEEDRTSAELRPKKKRRGAKPTDIPVWGKLVVYTSADESKDSLEAQEIDEQFVRLVKIADNAQLRLMLEAESELCQVDSALYVRVDPICPIYWVRWEDRKTRANLDVVCDIPHRGDRSTVLKRVRLNDEERGGVMIRHARHTPSETSTPSSLKPVLVSSECGRIVGSQSFGSRAILRDHGPAGEAGARRGGGRGGRCA